MSTAGITGAIPPSATSAATPVYHLNKVDIFDQLKQNICSVRVDDTKATGFYYNKNTVVSTCHSAVTGLFLHNFKTKNLEIDPAAVEMTLGRDVQQPVFTGYPGDGGDNLEHYLKKAQLFDLVSFPAMELPSLSSCFDPIPDDFKLKEGMEVYFGGYPLSQEVPTFHCGTISSITTDPALDDCQKHFTIDGTVVPGNSGGPVLIQHEGRLLLAGVIVSEVADLNPDFELKFSMLQRLLDLGDDVLGMKDDYTKTDGSEESVSRFKIIIEAITSLQSNLSTGIGTAIDARYIARLLDKDFTAQEEGQARAVTFATGKKAASLQKTCGETDSRQLKYYEGKGSGKGPRTIQVTTTTESPTTKQYKIPNPHGSGSYNEYHGNFYHKLAEAIEADFIKNGERFNESLTFDYDGKTFELTTR